MEEFLREESSNKLSLYERQVCRRLLRNTVARVRASISEELEKKRGRAKLLIRRSDVRD